MKRIEGRARTVRELLDGARYTIDFYQREYAWQERQVRELIDDLSGKFLDFYQPEHPRTAVESYGHYFLGSIVISHKRGQRFIVDGQQRLTTLSLLLIFLNHQQRGIEGAVDVTNLIYSERYGRKNFNLAVPEREGVMQTLLDGEVPNLHGAGESVVTIARRYENIGDHFPEEISAEVLPYFVDWLLENVHLVEIEAYSDEDAYTIFETMNDRGLSLSLAEMLKGYVLANITDEEDQRAVNTTWKAHMQAFKEFGDDEDIDFFKNWLRARYAETIRPGKKGAENKDVERIGSEFHRWVRDQRERIGLKSSESYVRFVQRDLNFYGKYALAIRRASTQITEGWESIYFNEDRGFTLQHQALLAALHPSDSDQVVRQKVRLVADFLDIWLARRVWNFRTIAYSSVKYTLFMLTRELRHRNVQELSDFLREQLDAQPETFVTQPRLRLHNQNYRQIRHILARLTHWVDAQCGLTSHFEDLVSQGRARPFEIEHIWADDYDRFADDFAHPSEFEVERNRLGGLLLLQRGLNQSLGDATFEAKRDAYVTQGESMLARSLHPAAYAKSPGFRALRERTGLAFKPYESFGPEAQAERQELYIRIAEWVWNPSRLEVDGGEERAPVHGEIVYGESLAAKAVPSERPSDIRRYEARYGFWKVLLAESHARSELHTNISPGRASYVGARRHGQEWNYVVLMEETRVELYINSSNPADNKPLFDALHAEREAIEAAFGDNLDWQRLDDKKVSRISYTVPGGWADEARWGEVAGRAVGAMERLYGVLGERVGRFEGV